MPDLDNKPTAGTAPTAQPTTAPLEAQKPEARQPQPRPCPQDCTKCTTSQHIFCSAKMLFDLSRAYQEQRQQTAELAKAVADIQQQLKKEQEVQLSIPFAEQG